MLEKILDGFKSNFSEFSFESTNDEDKNKATISAEKDWTKGFDIDIALDTSEIIISHSSKIKNMSYLLVLAITGILTYMFGGSILVAFGLVSDGGTTLKLFFIIPVFIFLIPTFLLSSFAMGKISPKDDDLLEKVKSKLAELGYDATIE